MPGSVRFLNETLAFLLEVVALALLAWWGFGVGNSTLIHILVGLGTPLAAALLWGLLAAPKARIRAPLAVVLTVKAVVFGGATIALYSLHHTALAVAFAVLVVGNTAAVTVARTASQAH